MKHLLKEADIFTNDKKLNLLLFRVTNSCATLFSGPSQKDKIRDRIFPE